MNNENKIKQNKNNNVSKDETEHLSFKELGLIEPILRSIKDLHFKNPTEIQEKTIPFMLNNEDVIGGSKTGSGKTLAFASGIIQKCQIKNQKGIKALILVPTRELADQVADSFKILSKYVKLNIIAVYGGISINPQIDGLRRADIVIATPGRLLDHMNRGTVNLSKVETMVLDEADMMFDMGFLPDVERIIAGIPQNRQTLLFSATISSEINYLTKKYMNEPKKVSSEEYVDPKNLKQVYYNVPNKKKFALLANLLSKETDGLVMVFCNTQKNTDFVADNLKLNDINSCAIHGGLTQAKRNKILKDFHKGKVYALICTDVAARGLDIKGVSHVYNYDTCRDPKQYIHRIGRTARAGSNGQAITLLSERDHENFTRVLDRNDVDVLRKEVPELKRINMELPPRFNRQMSSEHRSGPRRGFGPRREQSDNDGFNRGSSSGNRFFANKKRSSSNAGNNSYGSRGRFRSNNRSNNRNNQNNNQGFRSNSDRNNGNSNRSRLR